MIIKLDNVITKDSMGSYILQIDKDEIFKIEVREEFKNSPRHVDFPPTGYYGDGSCSYLYRSFVYIECLDRTIKIEFIGNGECNMAIEYLYNEMIAQSYTNDNNKFYKKGKK